MSSLGEAILKDSEPGPDIQVADDSELEQLLTTWATLLKENSAHALERSAVDGEPFQNIYKALENVIPVQKQMFFVLNVHGTRTIPVLKFRLHFAVIHAISTIAKWYELCEEYGMAEKYHKQCIDIIEKAIEEFKEAPEDEIKTGLGRCHFMRIYEHIRFAIVCSERDKQTKALEILVKAEELYHSYKTDGTLVAVKNYTLLALLDSLNSEVLQDMFTYVLFYLGQAYKITGAKEKAVLYLHMVLRRELEKKDVNYINWASDASKMASVMVTNMECFEAARNVLLAATAVLNRCSEEEKRTDYFKQNYAELGRCWIKLGNELLDASMDRLRDLEEQSRKAPKFQSKLVLTKSEIHSLGIECVQDEYDTILLIQSLHFPTIDLTEVKEKEMRGKYTRDFDEARAVFLPIQRWVNVAKAYYKIDEYASDYIDIVTDYSNAFKYLAFFEPSLERQIKMHKRRVLILEELLSSLSPKFYEDVFHFCLRELAEINETVYKLKVAEIKERGESLRPKDKKLVKWLTDSIEAHKRNLSNFKFDMNEPKKDFDADYEKALLGSVLSIGRILGSISHDHPLHPDALDFAVEGKKYYQFFLNYLDYHEQLKQKDFKVLYEGTQDMPDLMDKQIRKISEYQSRRHNSS